MSLSLAEYQITYGSESGWEYRAGAVTRKPQPNRLHGILAFLLADLLRLAGYVSAVEVDVHLTEDWSPRPDALGEIKPD
jgi:hypothetical protein